MPAKSYIDEDFWKKECETVLSNGWLFVGFSHEFKKSGDVIPITIADRPILLIRNSANEITAFHNVCSHRCLKLVNEKKNVGKIIQCPYHSWTYALDGRLQATPSMQDAVGFDKNDYPLPSVRAETWAGFVFINFDSDATPLLQSLGGLVDRLASYHMEDMVVTKKWENRFRSNWKIWVENSREGYHVRTVHRQSLDTYYPGAIRTAFHAEGEPMVYAINSSDNENGLYVPRNHTLPFIDGLSATDNEATHFIIHYPHLLLNVPPDRITFHQYFPEGPDWVRITSWCCFPKSTVALPEFETEVNEKYYPSMDMFLAEDKGVCELVHRGISGRMTSPSRYSPAEERTVHEFSNYVLDRVLGPQ